MQTEKEYLIGREINSLRCESVGEYSLPDYNGDVKKLLLVKAKAFPTGKFVGEDALEFSGTVGYEIVYLDAENSLTHAEFSTDYEAAVKISAESYVDSDVKTNVLGCNVRLVGPRKLMVKCSLDNDVYVSEKRAYRIEGDAFMEYEPEVLGAVAEISTPFFTSGEMRELSEEMVSIEGAIAEEVQMLLSDARFDLISLDADGDKVSVNGTVTVGTLLKNSDQPPRFITKQIPYSEELSLEDADGLEMLDARLEIGGMKGNVTPTEDGVSVSVTLSVAPRVIGKRNCSLDVITDAYVKERGSLNEYSEFGYNEHICTQSKEESLEFRLPLSELGIEGGADVVYAEAQARVEGCDILDNGVLVKGEIRFSGIAMHENGGEEPNYYPVRFSVQYTQNVNMNCQIHENMRAYCVTNASDPKIYFDENNVYANVDVTSFVTLSAQKRQRCLGASYLTDEEYSGDASVVTVYYPDASESLFTIAKKFHTSVGEIAVSNKLTESAFASSDAPLGMHGVKKLLIK